MLSTTCLEWLSTLGQWTYNDTMTWTGLPVCIEVDTMDTQEKVYRAMIAVEACLARPIVDGVWENIPAALRSRAQAISNRLLTNFEKKIRDRTTYDLPALRQELDQFAFHRVIADLTRPRPARKQGSPS